MYGLTLKKPPQRSRSDFYDVVNIRGSDKTMRYSIIIIFLAFFLFIPTNSLPGQDKPKLILANVYRENVELSEYFVSEKYDGVRGFWDGAKLMSRSGNFFSPPAFFTKNFPNFALDGELWMGRGRFEEISGIVRSSRSKEKWRQVKFMVFDLPDSKRVFEKRCGELERVVESIDNPYLFMVRQEEIATREELANRLKNVEARGGEGLILHKKDSIYNGKRSDDLLKVKSHADMEGKVLAHIKNKNGLTGSLLVELENGIRFKIGSGFKTKDKLSPPRIGSIVTFKHYGFNKNGVPKFASFLRVRDDVR
jgi:DNA ligase 1